MFFCACLPCFDAFHVFELAPKYFEINFKHVKNPLFGPNHEKDEQCTEIKVGARVAVMPCAVCERGCHLRDRLLMSEVFIPVELLKLCVS